MDRTLSETRRSTLKKMGAGGFVPLLNLTSPRKTKRLPELRDRNGVVKWIEVSKKWADRKDQAEKVASNLGDRYRRDPNVAEVGVVASEEWYGDRQGLDVEIQVTSKAAAEAIPNQVNGVRVKTDVRKEKYQELCYNGTYDGLPGGAKIATDSNFSNASIGSTAWKVKHNGTTMMVTAQHVVEDYGSTVYGDKTSSTDFQKVGEVHDLLGSDVDTAGIKSSRNIPNKIIGDGNTYDIGGWVTEDGIGSRVSDPFDGYRKMGITTGETTGGLGKYHIDDSYHTSTPSYSGHGVRGSADAASGDSGGAAFSLHNGKAYMTHLITHGDPKAGQLSSNSNCYDVNPYKKSIGVSAYHLDPGYEIQGTSHS